MFLPLWSHFYNLSFLPLLLWLWFLFFLNKPLLKIDGLHRRQP